VDLTPGTLKVNPYEFSYTIGNDSQYYGHPANLAQDLGTTIPTGVNGQNLDISYSSLGDTASAPVGTYDIDGTVSDGTGLAADYKVDLTPGTLTVNPAATVSGRVFNDQNGSGVDDPSDPGLQSWTVEVLDPNTDQVLETQQTDANGNYSFNDLLTGTYTIEELLQSGWQQTYPHPVSTYSITISVGNTSAGNDFGNFQLETFNGLVFNDINDNHVYESGDPLLADVPIYVDGTQITSTDTNGSFSVSLTAGGHNISEGIPSGYIAIAPASGSQSVTANQSGGTITGTDFADALPTATLDNGQQGYVNVPSNQWTVLGQGWNGNSEIHSATTNQKVYASWTVGTNVSPAEYEVFVTYASAQNRGSVYYTLYDGVQDNLHRIGRIEVSQSQIPNVSGNQNGTTSDGTLWLSLGKYAIDNGQLIVVMTGASTGKTTIDADGVLFIPAGTGQAPQGSSPSALVQSPGQQGLRAPVSADAVAQLSQMSALPTSNASSQQAIAALLTLSQSGLSQGTAPAAARNSNANQAALRTIDNYWLNLSSSSAANSSGPSISGQDLQDPGANENLVSANDWAFWQMIGQGADPLLG
jgi:hypothetical protein